MNADRFNAVPADQQKALVGAAGETVTPQVLKAKDEDQRQLEQLKQQGLQVYEVTDLESFRARTQPVFDKYVAMDSAIEDFADEVRRLAGNR